MVFFTPEVEYNNTALDKDEEVAKTLSNNLRTRAKPAHNARIYKREIANVPGVVKTIITQASANINQQNVLNVEKLDT